MRKGARGILIKAVVVIIIASVVGYWSFVLYNQKKEQNLVLEMCNNVKKTVPNGITKDKYYPDEQYIKDITCVSLCNLKLNTDGDCYEWTDGFHFTFNMEDNFDQLSQSEQYEIIKRLGLSAPITYSNEINVL